jgi:hypothetical protein
MGENTAYNALACQGEEENLGGLGEKRNGQIDPDKSSRLIGHHWQRARPEFISPHDVIGAKSEQRKVPCRPGNVIPPQPKAPDSVRSNT